MTMCDDFNVFDADLEYKSPIDMIVQQMSSEFDKMAENQLMLRVNQAVDFNVDKAELLKALQYDRNQYETGYLDAKKKYQRPQGEWIPVSQKLPERFKDVLCWAKSIARGGETCFVGSYDKGCWLLQSSAGTQSYPAPYEVVAWMELPEPYKEGDKE